MNFNPRTREGCDNDPLDVIGPQVDISIHAPVKGATPTAANSVEKVKEFQSTHP